MGQVDSTDVHQSEGKMSSRSGPIFVIGAATAAVAALCILVGGIAQANSPARQASEIVEPDVQTEDASYYEGPTASEAWKEVLAQVDLTLPDGYHFQEDFDVSGNGDDGQVYVESAVLDMWIAQQYRCAWLDAGIHDKVSQDTMDKAMAVYWTLPSISEFDQTGLTDETLEELTKSLGYTDKYQTLFALDCAGWWGK